MLEAAKYLLIGSIRPYSGKSATILGLAQQLQSRGLTLTYGKPISTSLKGVHAPAADEDLLFLSTQLNLSDRQICPPVLALNADRLQQRMAGTDSTDYCEALTHCLQTYSEQDIVLLEGPSSLDEGYLFGLSLGQMAQQINAAVLLVVRFPDLLEVESLLMAKARLGDRLLGVLLNDIPENQRQGIQRAVQPFLESQGISVFGLFPRNALLRSVSVRELVHQLQAEVLCCPDRLGLMVEQLSIGAMNVNSALQYFHRGNNMAVVTGGDRTDIQLAALESYTHCLILTGHFLPNSIVLHRAEDLEIPVLSVDFDTLTTVEIIDQAFGQTRVNEPVKVECIQRMMTKYFDIERLLTALAIQPAVPL